MLLTEPTQGGDGSFDVDVTHIANLGGDSAFHCNTILLVLLTVTEPTLGGYISFDDFILLMLVSHHT